MAPGIRFPALLLLGLSLSACGDKEAAPSGSLSAPVDLDEDGYPDDHDCDDSDPTRNPGAPEVCDGIDQDCDGLVDENATDLLQFFADRDGDGFGDASTERWACSVPDGYSANDTDCDDDDAGVNPSAAEVCDEQDNDCDELVDTDDPDIDPADLLEAWPDLDGDDHGDSTVTSQLVCDASGPWSLDDFDCDDNDPATWIGAAPLDDASACMQDIDNDGWGSATPTSSAAVAGGDCDDGRPLTNPDGLEFCDDEDNDCNTLVDDECEGEAPAG